MHLKIFAFQKPCLANFNFSSQIILITFKKVMMRIYSPPKFKISLMKFRFRVKIFSHTINNNEHQFSIVTRGFKYVNFLELKKNQQILIATHIDRVFRLIFPLIRRSKEKNIQLIFWNQIPPILSEKNVSCTKCKHTVILTFFLYLKIGKGVSFCISIHKNEQLEPITYRFLSQIWTEQRIPQSSL